MKRMNLMLAAVVCCSGMALARCGNSDQAGIQGTWQFTSMEVAGQKMTDAPKDAAMVITADTITVKGQEADDGKYTLNSSTSPKQLDLTPIGGSDKGKTIHCIYDLDGDNLKLCIPENPDKRPANFDGKGTAVMELVRKR